MDGKIALEEHFAIQDTLSDSAGYLPPHTWEELSARLMDLHDRRIREMDAHGIEIMILSLNAPAVQAIWDRKAAVELARKANDYLAEECAKRPDRFEAFAALPMQDPDAAAEELTRCVRDFGFKGAMVNGFTIDANFAVGTGRAAIEAWCRDLAALGHEDHADRRFGTDLEVNFLAKPAAIPAAAAAALAQLLVMDEQGAVALDQFDRNV